MSIRSTLVLVTVAGVAMVWLAANLPPHGFYTGDSGVKLIAARNVIAHPLRPLQVDLPVVKGQPVPYVERFFELHEQHAHALQSPLFPIVSAPFVALFGLRGAYVLPLASFLALPILLNTVRARMLPGLHSGWVLVFSTIASPVVFYALEFWEHVPAIACLSVATALAWRGSRALWAAVVSGSACAAAMLLRPEAAWYVAVLCWYGWKRGVLVGTLAGVGLVLAPFAAANFVESGHVAGPHVVANMAPLGDDWLAARVSRAALWFSPGAPLLAAAVALLVATRMTAPLTIELRRAQVLALALSAALALAASSGFSPQQSLWHAWPAAFLLFVPTRTDARRHSLWALVVVPITAIWLSSTHDGGAQWGPRFVLICAPALILLVAAICADATAAGFAQRLRQGLVLLVIVSCVWTTRAAYRELRGTKQIYARIVDTAARHIRPGAYVVSNLWWFDQVAAALYRSRSFLFAQDATAASAILQQLASSGEGTVSVVWSRDPAEGESLSGIGESTCYRFVAVQMLHERALNIGTAVCQPHRVDR